MLTKLYKDPSSTSKDLTVLPKCPRLVRSPGVRTYVSANPASLVQHVHKLLARRIVFQEVMETGDLQNITQIFQNSLPLFWQKFK